MSPDPVLDDVRAALPGYVHAMGVEVQDRDDIVQETLIRLLRVRERLDDEVVGSYGFVTARNLVVSRRRAQSTASRRLPELLDPAQDETGEEYVERREREAALLAALAGLAEADRDVLVSHELHGEGTGSIAQRHGKRPAAIVTQLARLRARVRLDYLLALRRISLESTRCRAVLLAISAGDVRRQRETRAGEHLMTCPRCADLAAPLMTRRMWLAALSPLGLGAATFAVRWWRAQSMPAQAVQAGGATLAAATVTAVVLVSASRSSTQPPQSTQRGAPAALPLAAAEPVSSTVVPVRATWAPGFDAAAHEGRPVVLLRAPVQSVPADEGFWIGTGPNRTDRMWVQLHTSNAAESPAHVQTGDLVSGDARIVGNTPEFLRAYGPDAAHGGDQLRATGVHAVIDAPALTVGH